MKRFKYMLGILILLMGTCVYGKGSEIFINNKPIVMDVEPEMKRSITYVPISFIAKELGAKVEWQSPNVIITKGDTIIKCSIDSNIVSRNGEEFSIIAKPYLSNGRTLVPLKFVSEQLNCKVSYDELSKNIYLEPNAGAFKPTNSSVMISNNDKDLILSNDQLWGMKSEKAYSGYGGETVVYLVNMQTGLGNEIYSTPAGFSAQWLNDNRLLLSGTKDLLGGKDRKHLMIYNPVDKTVQNILDVDSAYYVSKIDAIVYANRTAADDPDLVGSDCGIYYIADGRIETITQQQYSDYCNLLD